MHKSRKRYGPLDITKFTALDGESDADVTASSMFVNMSSMNETEEVTNDDTETLVESFVNDTTINNDFETKQE